MSKINGLLDILSDDDSPIVALITEEIANVNKQPLITARKIEFLSTTDNDHIEILSKFSDLSVQFYEIAQILTEIDSISPFIPSENDICSHQRAFIKRVEIDTQEVQLSLSNRATIFIDEQQKSNLDMTGSDTEYVDCVEHT